MTVEPVEGSEPDETLSARWQEVWPPISYWSRAAVVVIGVVIAVRILAALQNVLLIVIAAFVVALGLQPALAVLERRGMRRGAAMAVIVLAGLVLMAGAAAAIIPTIVSQAANAFERLPEIIADLEQRSPFLAGLLDQLPAGAGEGGGAFDLAGGLALGIFNTVTLLLLTPYFAVSFPSVKSAVFRLLRRQHREDFVYIVNQSAELTSNYILGNLTISLVAGVVTFLGLTLIGVPYAVALAAWVAITDLIPAFGALVGAVPVLVVAAVTGGEELIWSAVLLVAYQQFENYVLAPRVMKRAVDLSPPVVIVALMVGGTLAGIVGALLALPIAALAKILITEFLIRSRIDTVRADNGLETNPAPRRRFRTRVGSRPLP
ncbi:MAG TPA: AI-2E family transporter [Acidimicrobiia bacterium]|nr:AI-2E family transporter [Acidimicrobiia bacterium]